MKKYEIKYLKLAIERSKESAKKGLFPGGAVVACGNKLISSEMSAVFPDYKHAEVKATNSAFEKLKGQLNDCTLYCSTEPCLMCLGTAYWAGIRRIVYACGKRAVMDYYFESTTDNLDVVSKLNKEIEFKHCKELEVEAWRVVKKWEGSDLKVQKFLV